MNPETIRMGLQLTLAAMAWLREVRNDDAALQAIVDQARAEGRSVDLADVRASVDRMTGEGDSLRELIAAKQGEGT
jgi:hypothetical protein